MLSSNPAKEAANKLNRRLHQAPLSIVGLSFLLPGVEDLNSLWHLKIEGRTAFRDQPEGRPGQGRAAYLAGPLTYTPELCKFSEETAFRQDPQHLKLLEVVQQAVASVDYEFSSNQKAKFGCFVGLTHTDFSELSLGLEVERSSCSATGINAGGAAGLIAGTNGFGGPALVINSACSSGLSALHLACQSLRRGEIEFAVVAACHLLLNPNLTASLKANGLLSASGTCKIFDASVDGYLRGEAAVAFVLTSKVRANGLGLASRGTVLASALGSRAGMVQARSLPDAKTGTRLITSAMAEAKLQAEQIGYVEAAGRANRLGEALELESIGKALASPRETALYAGCGKSNLGNSAGASGLVGILRALLILEKQTVPPQAALDKPNPDFNWSKYPKLVLPNTQHSINSKYAAVLSSGVTGTDAAVLLEKGDWAEMNPFPLTLSPKPFRIFWNLPENERTSEPSDNNRNESSCVQERVTEILGETFKESLYQEPLVEMKSIEAAQLTLALNREFQTTWGPSRVMRLKSLESLVTAINSEQEAPDPKQENSKKEREKPKLADLATIFLLALVLTLPGLASLLQTGFGKELQGETSLLSEEFPLKQQFVELDYRLSRYLGSMRTGGRRYLRQINGEWFAPDWGYLNPILSKAAMRPASSDELEQWKTYFEKNADSLKKQGIHYLVVLPPSKLSLYPDLAPSWFTRKGKSRKEQLTDTLNPNRVSYIDLKLPLKSQSHIGRFYGQQDSHHWNQLGGEVASKATSKRAAELLQAEPLGPKKQPWVSGELPFFVTDRVFATESTQGLPKTVLFHDSFGKNMRSTLSRYFSRIVFVQHHDLISQIIEGEQPKLVIHEITEDRFLAAPPSSGLSQLSTLALNPPPSKETLLLNARPNSALKVSESKANVHRFGNTKLSAGDIAIVELTLDSDSEDSVVLQASFHSEPRHSSRRHKFVRKKSQISRGLNRLLFRIDSPSDSADLILSSKAKMSDVKILVKVVTPESQGLERLTLPPDRILHELVFSAKSGFDKRTK